MKRLINAIRDFFYEATDYAIILSVVIVIAVVLIWRFNILFTFSVNKDPIQSDPLPPPIHGELPDTPDEPDEPIDPDEDEDPDQTFTVTLIIPAGSSASTIGDLLVSHQLVEERSIFLERVVELGLDTRLKSGSFEVNSEMTLDDIIHTISQ